MELDAVDVKLLGILQLDATPTVQELAAEVGLSANACWRRIKHFEERGYIARRVAILDPVKLGVGTIAFVSVRASEHSAEWTERFAEVVRSIPEIVEVYRMAGNIDYLLKLRVSDIRSYDRVYQKIIAQIKLEDISAAFAMEEMKSGTIIPLPDVGAAD